MEVDFMIILHCTQQTTWSKESHTDFFGTSAINAFDSIKCIEPNKINSENFTFPSTIEHTILCINTDLLKRVSTKNEGDFIYLSDVIPTSAVIATIPYTYDNNDNFAVSKEIQDIIYINEVSKKLDISINTLKYFRDGTDSRIILLNDKYILKQNNPVLLKSEANFSKTYEENKKLQHVILSDEDYKYIVYEFIPGDVMHVVDNVEDLVFNIKELTNQFIDYTGDGFGYIHEPSASWIDFLKSRVHDASLTLPDSFDFLPQVYEAISTLEKCTFSKKLIHGDFGTHNFIKKHGDFVGAIDPIPIAGDPLYDFIFACLSNLDIVNHLSLEYLITKTGESEEKVKAMLIVLLFCRMSICLRHHKEDFDGYVDFWYKIVEN